ncbi:MAG: SUMF1/EgtB/PvdO family nonheme iron enzyme [Chitinophagales bacterium]|nr:SUMF1/EgtB/PvdO family nonheme iron enzyme [Chitinophagales bacterium]
MKIILPLLSLMLTSAALGAQSCYEVALQKGHAAYNQGDYARAARFWTTGKECDDADVKKLNNLIWKTRDDDGDGFVNGKDKCPKAAYAKNGGCPPPKPKDTDEDGLKDEDDECPNQYGPKRFNGCPDKDGDEIPDKDDDCPDDYGPKRTNGCPDKDGDGIRDKSDDCAAESGPAATRGCPDTDNDGVADKDDNCPNQAGPKSNRGCPLPPPNPTHAIPAGMVLVKGGTFTMGDEKGDGDSDEKPTHTVTIKDFYLGKYEVTNAEFIQFLNEKGNQTEGGVEWINLDGKWDDERCRIMKSGSTFSVISGYENYPVIYVSWFGAVAYCNWLKQKKGGEYRLPTEAEWEYAAGNGNSHTKYSWGNDDPSGKKGGNVSDLTAKAKYSSWSAFESYRDGYVYTAPVGQFDPNSFGLYDMTGNVWEWCADWYDSEYYKNSPAQNPQGPTSGSSRVLRGGSWSPTPEYCRVAYRCRNYPYHRNYSVGFRVARDY